MKDMQVELKNALKLQNLLVSNKDHFETLRNDHKYLKNKKIVYAIDAYDINTLLFDKNELSSDSFPFYHLTRKSWMEFLKNTKGDSKMSVGIGPLAVFECIIFYQKNSDIADNKIFEPLKERDVAELINEIEKMGKYVNDPRAVPIDLVNTTIKKAWNVMSQAKALSDKSHEKGLSLLGKYISNDEIPYLESIMETHGIQMFEDIFQEPVPKVHPEQGVKYLDYKRGEDYWSKIYNRIDISRFIAGAKLQDYFLKEGVINFVTSSGQITNNAWTKSWYGDKYESPARHSAIPMYLSKAYSIYGNDFRNMDENFEESLITLRKLCKDLNQVDILAKCFDGEFREVIDKNIMITLPNKIAIQALAWQEAFYYDYLSIEKDIQIPKETVDLVQLHKFAENSQERQSVQNRIVQNVIEFLDKDYLDYDKYPFFGPIDDAYVELNAWLFKDERDEEHKHT